MNIYERAIKNGCRFECTCVGIGQDTWEQLMKGARHANKKKVTKTALLAGVIDEEQARREIKHSYYNPYNHYQTKTHLIYVHSSIEYFILIY